MSVSKFLLKANPSLKAGLQIRVGIDQIRVGIDRIRVGIDRIRVGIDRIRVGNGRIRVEIDRIRPSLKWVCTRMTINWIWTLRKSGYSESGPNQSF